MDSRRVVLRLFIVFMVAGAAAGYLSKTEPVRGIDFGASRLVSSEPLQAGMMESCTWDVATPERVAFQGRQGAGGSATGPGPAMGDPAITARMR